MLFNKKLVCCQLKSGLIWLIWLIWLICWWQQVWVGWLVVRCVGDRSCTVQPHHFSRNQKVTTQDLLLHAGRDVLVHVDQPQHVRAAKGERKVLDRPRDREARVGVLILGLEVVHAGVVEVELHLGAGQPHMLRLCCAAQLAGVAACLSTHSPGRGRRSATWAPPSPLPSPPSLPLTLTPRRSLVRVESGRVWLGGAGSAAPRSRDRGPTSPAARPHCKVPLLWRAPASGLLPTREVG